MLGNDQIYVLSCLRSSLCGTEMPDESSIESEENVKEIILRNSILLTVYKCLSPSIKEQFKTQYSIAIKQSITQDYEGKRIIQKMRDAGAICVGLKGWEMRNLYPEFTMRQMSDIDLLISPYNFTKVRTVMTELEFGSGKKESASKNDTFRKNTVSVETHKRLTESSDPRILEWEEGLMDRTDKSRLSNEDFYIHHIIHMQHDFGNGSLGLRRIADTWLLQKVEKDEQWVKETLDKFGLSTFNDHMVRLSKACFADAPIDEQSECLIQHACKYGIFGTEKSYKTARVAARGGIEGGRIAALKDALFPPYDNMKVLYPELKDHPGLLPIYWSKRLLGKSRKLRKNIRKTDYSVVTEESYQEIQRFWAAGGYNVRSERKIKAERLRR